MAVTSITTKEARSIGELAGVFEFVRETLQKIAMEEIARVARNGGFGGQTPVLYVDGKKSGSVSGVKTFGRIVATAQIGPVEEAMRLAMEFVAAASGQFRNPTGFYAHNFEWFMNGQPAGTSPDIRRMGKRGNIALVQTTGYASLPETFFPDGILYGAASMLQRMFGKKLAVRFYYTKIPIDFTTKWPSGQKAHPLAVPVLMLGHPTATFKPGIRRPGVNQRKAAREAQRKRDRARQEAR